MRTTSKALVAALALATLAGCGSMSRQERNTAVGGGAVGHEWDRMRK
jgi:uncharacterized lipoprotein